MSAKRLDYIDAAKAIAIILVIIGHSNWLSAIPRVGGLIYSFHMPLFFIISGFFWKYTEIGTSLKKYAKAYLWPYLVICLFIFVADCIGCFREGGNFCNMPEMFFLKCLWASNWEKDILFGEIPRIGAAWFLFALFWGCFMLTLITKHFKSIERLLAVLMFVSFSLISIDFIEFPFSLQAGMLALLFIYVGTKIKEYQWVNRVQTISPFMKACTFCFWVIVTVGKGGVDLGSSNLGFSIVGFVNSLFAFFIVISLCVKYNCKGGWLGRNTLYVLAAHILTYEYFKAFGWETTMLSYSPLINLFIEIIINITCSLSGGYLLSKMQLFKFPQYNRELKI